MIAGDRPILPESSDNFYPEHTTFYTNIDYVVVVPQGREMTFIEKLYKPFKFFLWLTIGIFVTICIVFIITVLYKTSEESRKFLLGSKATTPLWNFTSLILTGSISSGVQIPSRNFARFMLAMMLFFFVIIHSSYTGLLLKFIIADVKISPAKELNEIVDKNFTVYFSNLYLEKLKLFKSYENMNVVLDSEQNIQKLNVKLLDANPDTDLNVAMVDLLDRILHMNFANIESGSSTYNYLSKPIFSYPRYFLVRRTSLLVDNFSEVIAKLHENGCLSHWKRLYQPNPRMFRMKKDPPKPLTMEMMSGVAYILICGWTLALIVFLLEFFCKM